MTYTSTVISPYALSRSYAADVAAALGGTPQFFTLTQLRERPVRDMIATLRKVPKGPFVIALEDPTSLGILPALKIMAMISSSSDLRVIDADLKSSPFKRWTQAGELVEFALAILDGQLAVARASRELPGLMRLPRIPLRLKDGVKRVAYTNTNLWFGIKAGGSVGHISGVANALVEHGYALDYLSVGGRLLIRPPAVSHDLTPPKVFGLPYETNLHRFGRMFEAQAARIIQPEQTSFIYQRLSQANYSGVRMSRKWNLPLVVEYNGSEVWVAANWGSAMRYEKPAIEAELATLNHAHVIVTISEVLRDELIERGVEPERIVTYPNCIDPQTFDPARFSGEATAALRADHDLPADACVATFVGTFGMWHGAEVLAEAIRWLAENRPAELRETKLHFLMVGDGRGLPTVKSILDNEACRPFVRFAGLIPQDQAPAYLAASDILVSPHVPNADGSRFFGSPTKLFEYLAMGKAIVASDLDQIGDVLANGIRPEQADISASEADAAGRLALLLEPGNVQALADGLLLLARRPDLRNALGGNARREALSKYTWRDHVGAILERLYALDADAVAPTAGEPICIAAQ